LSAASRTSSAELAEAAAAIVIPAGLAVATFLAATPWLRVFSVPGAAGLLVVAAVASVSIPFLAVRIWHQPPAVSYVASAVGLVVLCLVAGGPHPAALWHGLTAGPNRVLTETLPIGGSRAVLAAPILLTWLCGTASAELTSRAPAPSSGLGAIGLALPVACFVLAYAVGASRPSPDQVAAPLLLASLAAVALLRHLAGIARTPPAVVSPVARRSLCRPTLSGAAAVVAVAVILAVAVPSVPRLSGRPASLNRAPPVVTAVLDDPLDATAAFRDDDPHAPAHTVFRMATGQASSGYLATAILDDYDGGTWTFDATFRPSGGRIPAPVGAVRGAVGSIGPTLVRQEDTVVAPLPEPFLPVLDRPVAVTGLQIEADAATGMLMPDRAASLLSYAAVSDGPLVSLASVPGADGIGAPAGAAPAASVPAGSGAASPADVTLPPNSTAALASALRFLASISGRRPGATVAFLQTALASLHADERRIDPALPVSSGERDGPARPAAAIPPSPVRGSRSSGTSLSVVINAVINDRRATPEQFATLFALVARYLGVPARLVTGFRLGPSSGAGPVAAGTYEVTNRQAWTWVEIPVAGIGWVVADPTPDGVIGPGTSPPAPVQATPTTLPPTPANAVPRNEISGAHAVARPATVDRSPHPGVSMWGVVLAVLGGVLILAALLGPGLAGARRVLRRRARRQNDPSHLAVGAWLELLDSLQQSGMASTPGHTADEVATDAGRHFGPDVTGPVHEVGVIADQAMFSLHDPPDHQSAQRAWETQKAVRGAVRDRLDHRQRVRALLAVGSAPRRP
jgi:hypothetical protein